MQCSHRFIFICRFDQPSAHSQRELALGCDIIYSKQHGLMEYIIKSLKSTVFGITDLL